MSPSEVHKILSELFSKDGTQINGVKLRSKNPLNISINQKQDNVEIIFTDNKPKASIKKFITINTNVEKITLNSSGGWIKLEYFPEFSFSYEKLFKDEISMDTSDIQDYIDAKYATSRKNREIATLCLQYANDWATIASRDGNLYGSSTLEKYKFKNECYKYVTSEVTKEVEKKYGSVILTYLVVFIIIPSIARFIIAKLLDKYF